MLLWKNKKKTKNKTKPHQKNWLGWGERVCTVLQLQNSKPKDNVYIYVLCGAVSWSFYPDFSIFKSCCIAHWRKGQELFNAWGRIAKEGISSWGGISLGTEGESLLNLSHDCLTLFLWSKVEMGNGFIPNLCLTCCPLVVSIMSHPFWMLSSWNAGESTFPEKRNKLLVTIQMTMSSVGINEHLVCTFCNIEYWFDLVKTRWILGYLGEYPESFWGFSFTWICSNCFITVLKLLTGFLSGVFSYWITGYFLNYRSVRLFCFGTILFKHAIIERRNRVWCLEKQVDEWRMSSSRHTGEWKIILQRWNDLWALSSIFLKIKLYSALFIYAFYNSKAILD